MKSFGREDINTEVRVINPLSQRDADRWDLAPNHFVGQIGRVVRVDDTGALIEVRTELGTVWLSWTMLERGTLVQTWVPEQTDPVCASRTGGACTCPGVICLVGSR